MWKNSNKFIIVASLLFLIYGNGHAQNINDSDRRLGVNTNTTTTFNGIEYDEYGNPILPEEETEVKTDSTKVRERKPLESYFFDNNVRAQANFAWNISTYMNRVSIFNIDTLINDFQTDYLFQRNDIGDAYMGNLGGGTIPLNYFRRPDFQDYSFAQPYYAYLYTPETAPFYNVKKPYTMLSYSTSGQRRKAEEIISVIHAQNITPSTGFNVTYHTNKTKGRYANQATNDVNLAFGISHTGKRYSGHAGYVYNGIDNFENGGIVDDWHLSGNYEDLWGIPVRLGETGYYSSSANESKARSIIKNNTFYTVHSYGIPLRRITEDDFSIADVPAVFVGYAFEYQRWHRKYYDTWDAAHVNIVGKDSEGNPSKPHYPTEAYFKDWFYSNRMTQDSLSESKMSNRFFIQLQPWDRDGIVGVVDAGIGMDNFQYYMFRPDDYITGNSSGEKKSNFYFYGAIEGKFRKYFDWGANAKVTPLGYRAGDIDAGVNARLNVFIKEKPISLSGDFSYRRSEPSYWEQSYYSNHYIWVNNFFEKENETRLNLRLSVPHINAEVSFHQSIVNNKIYYGPDFLPKQHGGAVSVTGVYARKDFRFGGLNLNHQAMLQWSTNQNVIPVPLASVYLSYFFEFNVVKNVMKMRIGVDGRWNTAYNGYGYNPAIGQFYNQDEMKLGGYPMLDFFVSAKWKRVRIRFKITHLNEGLFGDNYNYLMVLHQPLNPRVFKVGISWGFYD